MSRLRFILWTAFLGLAACIALACGSSRQLTSITVAPATADAQNYPNGKVPFVATGYYNARPTPVVPLQAGWGATAPGQVIGPPTSDITFDANGTAQCAAGASGTYTVGAWVNVPPPHTNPPIMCPVSPYGNSCSSVVGTAQLTCP